MAFRFRSIGLVLFVLFLGIEAIAQTPNVSLSPASILTRVDSMVTLTVRVDNVVQLHGYSVTLGFDPALIRCMTARKGSFLTSTLFLFTIDSINGKVTLDEAILGLGTKTGSGSLAQVDIWPKKSGLGQIDILKADLRDASNQTIVSTVAGATIRVNPLVQEQKDVVLQGGWNLISIPVRPVDSSVTTLFPTALSSAFKYTTLYEVTPTLSCGTGYWIKFADALTVTIDGEVSTVKEASVRQGWNMVGPFEMETPVSFITTSPPSIVVSTFFGFSDTYQIATTLLPGKGYWVKTSQDGKIIFSSASPKVPVPTARIDQDAAVLEFTDARNSQISLKLGKGDILPEHELPPLPPEGAFDVRFAKGTNYETLGKASHDIRVQASSYPLRVRARNLRGMALELTDGKGTRFTLDEGNYVVLNNRLDALSIIEATAPEALPTKFGLLQNYPNPFNPNTIIRYQLPIDNSVGARHAVTLRVFDLLGREVATLVNEEKKPGSYTVTFDAGNLASGVYLYRLQAGNFVETRRMTLMK